MPSGAAYFDRFHRPLRRTLPRQAREHGVPRRHVVARMDHHVLRCHAKIPHPSLQRRAFVHSLASGEFKATFGDPDAGRGDPDRRLQLFRHAGQVLPCRSLGILPDARDLRLEQRTRCHKVGIESRQTLFEALRLRQRRGS